MATRAKIDRLAQRIDRLVDKAADHRPRRFASICYDPRIDVSQDAAIARHMADNPADRHATDLIIVKLVSPGDVRAHGNQGPD